LGTLAFAGYVTIGLIVLFALVVWRLVVVSFERSRRAEAEMQARLSERTDELRAAMALAERERVEAEGRRRGAQEVAIREERALVVDTIGKGLAKLAEQDLRYRIDAKLPNAYEGLRKNFDVALGKLGCAVAGVAGGVDTLRAAAVGISSDADLLSRHADEQTASLERAVSAQQAIGESVRRSLTSAAEAQKVVEVARQDAATSEAAVHRSIEAMKEIEASSRQISQIIVVIDEIAFQTNLLALNAGVEAARAGDAGRGFAVVAQEVRGLAQKSADAAKQIKALIAQSSGQVVEGAELVAENGASLRRMVERVLEINGVMAGVSEGAKSSAASLGEIAEVFQQMNRLAEANAKVAERSATAAHDLTDRTDELADHIERFAFADAGPGKARALAA
jgi:methyl-accepting chemotaxis protein